GADRSQADDASPKGEDSGRLVLPEGEPLVEALLAFLRRRSPGVRIQAGDFRPENVPEHMLMNFRLVNEHGRVLAVSRQLSQLRAAYGSRAQSAFQSEFSRIASQLATRKAASPVGADGREAEGGRAGAAENVRKADAAAGRGAAGRGAQQAAGCAAARTGAAASGKGGQGSTVKAGSSGGLSANDAVTRAGVRHTRWEFGDLPELLEIETKGGGRLIGFPALIDKGDGVELNVFDDPAVAARQHRDGVMRLFALAMNEAVKSFEKDTRKNASLEIGFNNLPGNQTSGMPLAAQLIKAAIVRSCFVHGVPQTAAAYETALQEGRQRMLLTAQAIAKLLATITDEHTQLRRKLNGARLEKDVAADIEQQLAALFPPGFLHTLDYEPLSHYPRYLKAIAMRLDKLRENPARDRQQMTAMAPLLNRWRQWQRDLGMQLDAEAERFRWLLEELRVSLFAQSLRTPVQVSVKRLTQVLDQRER
ncbi:MAG: DUF3418 domain-containing protein, partial [Lautropia sp.]|nr:DUF3418 domain-containing protein [Lautropia sp.]